MLVIIVIFHVVILLLDGHSQGSYSQILGNAKTLVTIVKFIENQSILFAVRTIQLKEAMTQIGADSEPFKFLDYERKYSREFTGVIAQLGT